MAKSSSASVKFKPIKFEVREQGVSHEFSFEQAIQFMEAEAKWLSELVSIIPESLVINNYNLGASGILPMGQEQIRNIIAELKNKDIGRLETYLNAARRYDLVIGQGLLGQQLNRLRETDVRQAGLQLVLLSSAWVQNPQLKDGLALFRAATFAGPTSIAGSNLMATDAALQSAAQAQADIEKMRDEFDVYVAEKKELVDTLEKTMREKLALTAPAQLWRRTYVEKTYAWAFWLLIFITAILVPLYYLVLWSDAVVAFVTHVTATNNGASVSFGGVAAITIPALFYAWLLKNISRLFIQSLALADDAAHRDALARTYLGLAENVNLNIGEPERALVLNALFRPLPPYGSDDGPPLGLVDLIRNKSS